MSFEWRATAACVCACRICSWIVCYFAFMWRLFFCFNFNGGWTDARCHGVIQTQTTTSEERRATTAKSAHATLGIYFARLYGKWVDRVGALILCRTLHSNKNWLFSREFFRWGRRSERERESERKTHAHVMSFEFVEYIFLESVIDPFTVVHSD